MKSTVSTILIGKGLNCRQKLTFVFGHFFNQVIERAATTRPGTSCEVVKVVHKNMFTYKCKRHRYSLL